jgi:hypothetical protein
MAFHSCTSLDKSRNGNKPVTTVTPLVQGKIQPRQRGQFDQHCSKGIHQNGEFAAFLRAASEFPSLHDWQHAQKRL